MGATQGEEVEAGWKLAITSDSSTDAGFSHVSAAEVSCTAVNIDGRNLPGVVEEQAEISTLHNGRMAIGPIPAHNSRNYLPPSPLEYSRSSLMRFSSLFLASSSLCLVLLPLPSCASAAPLTFGFEATVDAIVDTVPFDSGLEVNIGDKIAGVFTFEPNVAIGEQFFEVVQQFPLVVSIDGETLSTPDMLPDITLQSSNNNGIEDFPPAQVIDTIEVFSALGPSEIGALPNVDPSRSLFWIRLFGDTSILDAPGFPADVNAWNSFEFTRAVQVSLRGKSGGSLAFSAAIGDFIVVPEPASMLLGVCFLWAFVCHRATRSCEM